MTKREAIDYFNKIWNDSTCHYPREMSNIVKWLNNVRLETELWNYTEVSGIIAKGIKVCHDSGNTFEFVDCRVWDNYKADYVEKGLFITVSAQSLGVIRRYSDGSCERLNIVYKNNYEAMYMCSFCTENPEGKDVGRAYYWTIYPNDKQQKFHSWDIRDSATNETISGGFWDYDREEYMLD